MSSDRLSLIAGSSNPELSADIAKYLGVPLGEVLLDKFSDGETRVQILANVRGRDVFIIQPTCPPANDTLMELLIMIDAVKRASARRITAVLPYYGYGRQTMKSHYQSPITAKLVADLISKAGPDRVLTLDLHAGQIQGFYSCPVDALKSDPVILGYLRDQFPEEEESASLQEKLVIVAPDASSIKRASRMAARLDAKMALIDEREGELHVVGEVAKNAVIVKDMIDTGASVVKAADALLKAGCSQVSVACTHALLSGDCVERINNSSITEVVVTDSTAQIQNRDLLSACPKLTVLSVASLMGEAIRRIHNDESVTALFRYE
jgi:ribose-phosphate pyrophosphokinase